MKRTRAPLAVLVVVMGAVLSAVSSPAASPTLRLLGLHAKTSYGTRTAHDLHGGAGIPCIKKDSPAGLSEIQGFSFVSGRLFPLKHAHLAADGPSKCDVSVVVNSNPHDLAATIDAPTSVSVQVFASFRAATGPSSVSGLPPCPSATATGCDKSKTHATSGSRGSAVCKGKGPRSITASPIALRDIAFIQPMGLMIGGHVTPIDHGYFYIKGAVANPPRQAPVYAPLDGIITSVTRTVRNGDPAAKPDSPRRDTYDDYAVTIEATCTFRVRFSNLAKFAGTLGRKIRQLQPNQSTTPNYTVKAGELIGYTGLPTAYGIDVWVENDASILTGFINPTQYTAAEVWKTHVVDLFASTKEPLKSQLLALDERDAAPRWGKIDYDIDGKLVGNWFRVGSGGYGGRGIGEGYWTGHLAVVYDGNDPEQIDISFGDYEGQPQQFAVVGNSPDPARVDQSTGLVKYELGQIEYYSAGTGQLWDHQHYAPHIRTRAGGSVMGTVLMQLTGQRKLKMEIFPGQRASAVRGFDGKALSYER